MSERAETDTKTTKVQHAWFSYFDGENRLAAISDDAFTKTYVFAADGWDAGYAVTLTNGLTIARAVTRDPHRRHLVTAVSNAVGVSSHSAIEYGYDILGNVTDRNNDAFGYNARYELAYVLLGADRFNYSYDSIGNNLWISVNAVTNTYAANRLNQYSNIVLQSYGLQPYSLSPSYDTDGNMTRLGEWYHTWDAENRLTGSQPVGFATNGAVRLEYVYNHNNLRVAKIKKRLSGRGAGYPFDPSQAGTWDAIETRRYVWDGYNIAAEIVIDEVAPSTNVTYYTWGLDLSGTLQGAGGVGGLLAVTTADLDQPDSLTTYYPSYDANGNVTDYIGESGLTAAHYEYSPFGEIVAQSGDLADTFTHRFSTKPFDVTTGKIHYELRPYDPLLGRWMSRDPIGDLAFMRLYLQTSKVTVMEYVNLLAAGRLPPYLFVLNNPLSSVDAHGLDITLTTGNKNAAWWQVGNRFLHQEICVDTWVNDPSNPCCRKKGPRKCFSFAATGFGFDWPNRDWLGQESCQLGGPLQGEVYGTGDQGRKDSKSLKTTCEQDEEFLKKLEGLEGQSGTYSLLRHSCRTFSQMMFDEASQAYCQNPDSGAKDKDCECPKK